MSKVKVGNKTATSVRSDDMHTYVRYHETDIVTFNEVFVTLFTGGHFTPTTKRRMNQVSEEYNLGYHVFQKNKEWFVQFGCERDSPYEDKFHPAVLPFDGNQIILMR